MHPGRIGDQRQMDLLHAALVGPCASSMASRTEPARDSRESRAAGRVCSSRRVALIVLPAEQRSWPWHCSCH
jgi:hypothetical protein